MGKDAALAIRQTGIALVAVVLATFLYWPVYFGLGGRLAGHYCSTPPIPCKETVAAVAVSDSGRFVAKVVYSNCTAVSVTPHARVVVRWGAFLWQEKTVLDVRDYPEIRLGWEEYGDIGALTVECGGCELDKINRLETLGGKFFVEYWPRRP